MLSLFLTALIVIARTTTMLDFPCSAGDTCSDVIPFLSEENAKQETPVPDAAIGMLTPICNTDDGYCSIDCSPPFVWVCASVPEGQIIVDASDVYCDADNSWCAVDLTCTTDIDCTSKLPGYKCSSTGACIPSSSIECTDNSDCTADGFGHCDSRTYSGVTVSFCEAPPPTVKATPSPTQLPTLMPIACGFIVLETRDDQFARPLDVCTNSFDNNGSITESMMITCKDNVYTRTVFDDDGCNGTVTSSKEVDCVDCVCGIGSECEYATWTRYVDTVNETCDGTSYIEMAVVLNECTNGMMYECGANETDLLYQKCGDCVDKSGSATSNEFTVEIAGNCSSSSLVITITYDGYDGNWFGIVFAENMTGDGNASALVYTSGKSDETQRSIALYSYRLSSKEGDASGVIYNGIDSDPQELLAQTINSTLQLRYYWTPTHDVFKQDVIPFMWARGDTDYPWDHHLTFHGFNHALDAAMITLSAATGQKDVCDLECNEGEVAVTTTEMPEIETTKGIETTEEASKEIEPKSSQTAIIIGSVVGVVVLVLIGICTWLYCRKDKSETETSGYGAVDANDTDNEDVNVEMGTKAFADV